MDIWDMAQMERKPLVASFEGDYQRLNLKDLQGYCDKGNMAAVYELAMRYKDGVNGVKKDETEANYLFLSVLREHRHLGAIYHVGVSTEEGFFGVQHSNKCVQLYSAGSKWGSGMCSVALGQCYQNGTYVAVDLEKALQYYILAVDQGNGYAFFNIGDVYRMRADYEKAKYYYEKALEEYAMYEANIHLGYFYENGLGVEKDENKAFDMYINAYNHGITGISAYRLGRLYFYGRGVWLDNAKAYQLFQVALKEGIAEANYFLGMLSYIYENKDLGLEKNIDVALSYLDRVPQHMKKMAYEGKGGICEKEGLIHEAKKWYAKAVELGSQAAAKRLSKYENVKGDAALEKWKKLRYANINDLLREYRNGDRYTVYLIANSFHHGVRGARIDYAEALKFYKEVIDTGAFGGEFAYLGLANMYINGNGCSKNIPLAIEYYKISADSKVALSCCALGELYQNGEVVPLDYNEAAYWFRKGAELNDLKCKTHLSELYAQGKITNE